MNAQANAYYSPQQRDRLSRPRFCNRRSLTIVPTRRRTTARLASSSGTRLRVRPFRIKFDQNGNLADWWTAGDRERFEAESSVGCAIQ